MAEFVSDKIRNIALLGHSGEGKTTFCEAVLFNAKATDRMGKTVDGTTVTDFDPEEIARKISINLTPAFCVYKGVKFNLLDTPGFFDFEGERSAGLHATEAAIVVTRPMGLSVGTELALEVITEKKIPAAIYVGNVSKENSDFFATINEITALYPKVSIMFYPIMEGGKMTGYIDVSKKQAYDVTGNPIDFPAALQGEIDEAYDKFIETIAESSDELIEKFFEGTPFTEDEINTAVKASICNGLLIPVLVGSSTRPQGVNGVMDKIIEIFPSPLERNPSAAKTADDKDIEVKCSQDEPFAAQIFKSVVDPFVGKLLYFKVLSGKVKAGEQVYNANAGKTEKMSALFIVKGKKQEGAEVLYAGDIGAVAKLQYTGTGDTLCADAKKITFNPIEFPLPVISLAVTSAKQGEEDKVVQGISKLCEEDATTKIIKNLETGDVELFGMGETQLDIICKKLKNKFSVEAKLVNPRVPYRETIKKMVEQQGKHKKQSGGSGQYGDVRIRFEPCYEEDFVFAEEVVGGSVPKNYHPAVEKGLREMLPKGVLAGYPMVNIKATLYDGSYHDVDSNELSFKLAAHIAFKEGLVKAGPVLLEPIMKIQVTVPEKYMGDIMSDLNKRRGRINGTDVVGSKQVISADVPQHELFKYATDLRSMTQGRGKFKLEFDRYEEAPPNIAQKVIAATKSEG